MQIKDNDSFLPTVFILYVLPKPFCSFNSDHRLNKALNSIGSLPSITLVTLIAF